MAACEDAPDKFNTAFIKTFPVDFEWASIESYVESCVDNDSSTQKKKHVGDVLPRKKRVKVCKHCRTKGRCKVLHLFGCIPKNYEIIEEYLLEKKHGCKQRVLERNKEKIIGLTNWPEHRFKQNMLTVISRLKTFKRCKPSSPLRISATCEVSGDGAGPNDGNSAIQTSATEAACPHNIEDSEAEVGMVALPKQRAIQAVDGSTWTKSVVFAPIFQSPSATVDTLGRRTVGLVGLSWNVPSPDIFTQSAFDTEIFDGLSNFEGRSTSPFNIDQDIRTLCHRHHDPCLENIYSEQEKMRRGPNTHSSKRNRELEPLYSPNIFENFAKKYRATQYVYI